MYNVLFIIKSLCSNGYQWHGWRVENISVPVNKGDVINLDINFSKVPKTDCIALVPGSFSAEKLFSMLIDCGLGIRNFVIENGTYQNSALLKLQCIVDDFDKFSVKKLNEGVGG